MITGIVTKTILKMMFGIFFITKDAKNDDYYHYLAGRPDYAIICSKLTLWTSKADLFKIISGRGMRPKIPKSILKMMFGIFFIRKIMKKIIFVMPRPAGDN